MDSKADEKVVEGLLRGHGLKPQRFAKEERQGRRTPDFRVYKGDNLAFYCEVKTVSSDEWLGRQLAEVSPGFLAGGVRSDPIYNRLSQKIHEAYKQFDSVNPHSEKPNVLALINHDDLCGLIDLYSVLTGDAFVEEGRRIPMFRKFSEGRVKNDKSSIHLYIWLDLWKETKNPLYRFSPSGNPFICDLCLYFGCDPKALSE